MGGGRLIHRIDLFTGKYGKCCQNQLRYPMSSDLYIGFCYPPFEQLGPGLFYTKQIIKYLIDLSLLGLFRAKEANN